MPEPVNAATESVTVPGPVPLEPPVTVIHDTVDDAVHAQAAGAVTLTGTVAAAPAIDTPLLDNDMVQVLPVCVTVNPRPATLSVPTRVKAVLFGATEYWTVPSPVPDPPDVTVSHPTLLDAAHTHPADAVTTTEPLVPAPLTVAEAGASVIVHAAPVCMTVTVSPEIVSVPVRDALPVFAATL